MAISNNIVRVGIVSTVDPETMTATVIFPDKDNTLSGPLQIMTQGSGEDKYYWLPNVGDYLTYSPCLKAGDSWIQTILAY